MASVTHFATSSVIYISIGTKLTVIVHTHDETSSTHQLQTPDVISLAKTSLYRNPPLVESNKTNLEAALDNFLRSIWDSFHLQFVPHIVLLVDVTDTLEFKCHVLRWLSVVIPFGSTVTALSYPIFVYTVANVTQKRKVGAEYDGYMRHAVVIDLGHTSTRIVPILHGTPVQEMTFFTLGMGRFTSRVFSEGPAKSFCRTLSLELQETLESYVDLAIYVEEAIKDKGEKALMENSFIAEVDARSQEIKEQNSPQELSYIEGFIDGLEHAVIRMKQNASRAGIRAALNIWLITGGGAHILAVNRLLGFLLGKHLPDSMMVWV